MEFDKCWTGTGPMLSIDNLLKLGIDEMMKRERNLFFNEFRDKLKKLLEADVDKEELKKRILDFVFSSQMRYM